MPDAGLFIVGVAPPVEEEGEVALKAEPAPGDCCIPLPPAIAPDRGGTAGIEATELGLGDGDGRTPTPMPTPVGAVGTRAMDGGGLGVANGFVLAATDRPTLLGNAAEEGAGCAGDGDDMVEARSDEAPDAEAEPIAPEAIGVEPSGALENADTPGPAPVAGPAADCVALDVGIETTGEVNRERDAELAGGDSTLPGAVLLGVPGKDPFVRCWPLAVEAGKRLQNIW